MSAQFASQSFGGAIGVLLVGDSTGDAGFIRDMLEDAGNGRFELEHAKSLADALGRIDEKKFQAILFDRSMADSEGPEALARIRQYKPTVPVIVLTGGDGEDAQMLMLKEKSHGYVAKKHLSPHLLTYAICSAIQTHALQQELREARWRENQEKRLRLLERLSGSPQAAVTAHNLGVEAVKDALPGKFRDLSQRYGDLLEMALTHGRTARDISEGLRAISEELGALKAAPRDLLDVHSETLRIKSCGSSLEKAKEYADEGRLMLIEAMGYLVSYYRNYSNYAMSVINTISPEARRAPRPAALQPLHALM